MDSDVALAARSLYVAPTTDDDRNGLVSKNRSGKYSQLVLLGPHRLFLEERNPRPPGADWRLSAGFR